MATEVTSFLPNTLERMVLAVENVKERMQRTAAALSAAGVPYAIIGGNAVAAWVLQVGGGVRTTVDVDVAVRRADFDRVRTAMEAAGFIYDKVWDIDCFLDNPSAKPSESVHVIFADEKVRSTDPIPFPGVEDPLKHEGINYLGLRSLVIAKLTAYRRKDQTHLDDFIRFGLVDRSWLAGLPDVLAERLERLIDSPE